MKILRILWGALFASTFVYLIVLFVVPPQASEPPELSLVIGMAVAAVGTAVTSLVVPRVAHAQALARHRLEVIERADTGASDILPYRDAPKRRVFADPKAAESLAFATFNAPFLLSLAMAEATALVGFVLAFLGLPLPRALPFFGVAWVLMAVRFPTLRQVIGPVERFYGASSS